MNHNRIFNFSAGPANLPLEVLLKAQEELLNYKNSGMSIMEMSHRSKEFLSIIESAEENTKKCLNIPSNYHVLFLQGGASLQFAMIPMNLTHQNPNTEVDLIQTGSWTKKASQEISKCAKLNIVASTESENFSKLPQIGDIQFSEEPSYIHMASNNTIFGTQFNTFPVYKDVPLVADMSSDILSRNIDVSKFGIIFAGAQKNLGPSGVALVIIRDDLVQSSCKEIPKFLQYRTHVEGKSLYNTPPTFAIYMIDLVLKWILNQGGLNEIEKLNQKKANLLYNYIDSNEFYYSPLKNKEDRSLMNIVFCINKASQSSEELEALFVKESAQAQIANIKGHRSVGGLRASIYNAMPSKGVEHLIQFMDDFKKKYT